MTELPSTLYDTPTVTGWLDGMVEPLMSLIGNDSSTALIGIRRGGVDVGRYLLDKLTLAGAPVHAELGELNIAFYRDDFSSVGLHPVVGPSQVPFDVDNRHILLVDDVLGTGRTVRAAMNEIFDYGRPARISLAVLVQRDGHELPIRADVTGQTMTVQSNQYIDLDADNMQLNVGQKA
ncbi:bifunctional pyr operon transcriptional regulator/uracil phosphoribosyltransferase PyrR [Granulosicoccus sp. 3-233]|uniref:bifunctional pyr operon transcriptional regulator/uracil phosphoribosyltransferase PyrR n=1 Tax=Granulosicoccus sp. 3-233 TaxID=3417969 RepID=UPI003D35762A